MKKSLNRKKEDNRKPRRLTLSRETIQVLTGRSLLELAQGGTDAGSIYDPFSGTTTEGTDC